MTLRVWCEGRSTLTVTSGTGDGAHYRSAVRGPFGSAFTQPLARDLVRLAQAIFVADRAFRRGTRPGGRTRRLGVEVEVEALEPASSAAARLAALARFVSHDEWDVRAVPLTTTVPLPRPADRRRASPPTAAVSLLSEGLDSLCGAAAALRRGETLTFVTHTPPSLKSNRERIGALSRALGHPHWASQYVAFSFTVDSHDSQGRRSLFPERSRRTRPLLYLAMAGAVAIEHAIPTVLLNENGVLAVNLPIDLRHSGPNITRHAHPEALRLFGKTLRELWPHPGVPRVENPFTQLTKGEQLGVLEGARDIASTTISCIYARQQLAVLRGWMRRHSRPADDLRECGLCPACLVRRAAFHHAGAPDPDGRYVFNARRSLRGVEPNRDAPLYKRVLPEVEELLKFCTALRAQTRSQFVMQYANELSLLAAPSEIATVTAQTYDLYQRFAVQVLRFLGKRPK